MMFHQAAQKLEGLKSVKRAKIKKNIISFPENVWEMAWSNYLHEQYLQEAKETEEYFRRDEEDDDDDDLMEVSDEWLEAEEVVIGE